MRTFLWIYRRFSQLFLRPRILWRFFALFCVLCCVPLLILLTFGERSSPSDQLYRSAGGEFCADALRALERDTLGMVSAWRLLRDLLRTQRHLARAYRWSRGDGRALQELNLAYRIVSLMSERVVRASTVMGGGRMQRVDDIEAEIESISDVRQEKKPLNDSALRNVKRVFGSPRRSLRNELVFRGALEPIDARQSLRTEQESGVLADVCPEEWLGVGHGYPLYYTGHRALNCTNVRPLYSVLTILLDTESLRSPTRFNGVLQSLSHLHPNLTVHLFNVAPNVLEFLNSNTTRRSLNLRHHSSQSAALNSILADASPSAPRYVVWLRDLQAISGLNASLVRLVQASYYYGFDVVGGSYRTRSGRWSRACVQLGLKNYTLSFVDGYDLSLRDCLVCDFTSSPFLVRRDVLRKTRIEGSDGFAFLDWFLRLKQADALVGVCPDVMFELESDAWRRPQRWKRERWIPLVRKWELNRVVFPGTAEDDLKFNCDESQLSCKLRKGIADPICCLEELATAQRFFHHSCAANGIYTEMYGGSLLGVCKFAGGGSGMLPWEIDFDACVDAANLSALRSLTETFRLNGYTLADEYSISGNYRYLTLTTPHGYRGEIYPETSVGLSQLDMFYRARNNEFSSDDDQNMNLTRVLLYGELTTSNYNPCLAARNEYGSSSLQHAEHWRSLGEPNGWQVYIPRFQPCPTPGHHACLDQFLPDGDLQFN